VHVAPVVVHDMPLVGALGGQPTGLVPPVPLVLELEGPAPPDPELACAPVDELAEVVAGLPPPCPDVVPFVPVELLHAATSAPTIEKSQARCIGLLR
jgi:hypothetical protein